MPARRSSLLHIPSRIKQNVGFPSDRNRAHMSPLTWAFAGLARHSETQCWLGCVRNYPWHASGQDFCVLGRIRTCNLLIRSRAFAVHPVAFSPLSLLSLQLNVGPSSSGLLDRRKPGSGRLSGSFWASRPGRDGFRWIGGCADGYTQSPKPPPDTRRGELWWVAWPFPRQSEVVNELASETELGVGGKNQPGPPVGLFGHPQRWCRPSQCPLHEPEGVFVMRNSALRAKCELRDNAAPARRGLVNGGARPRVVRIIAPR